MTRRSKVSSLVLDQRILLEKHQTLFEKPVLWLTGNVSVQEGAGRVRSFHPHLSLATCWLILVAVCVGGQGSYSSIHRTL